MSHSSADELEKKAGGSDENEIERGGLTQGQVNLVDSLEPPFTADGAEEDVDVDVDVEKERGDSVVHDVGDEEDEAEAEAEADGRSGADPAARAGDNDGASLAQVPSSRPSVNNIKSVPNGGLRAWLQVLSSFFVFFNTWGIVNAFGIYQTYYETGILAASSPSDISWIGSLQGFLLMLVSSVAGPIYDAGYARELLLAGSLLIVFGQMMLSLSSQYYQVLLAQGVCVGVGTGAIFVTGVAILSTYFSTRLGTAVGVAASGSSIGGLLYPIVFYRLQPHIGFPWATRVLGFMSLATLTVSNVVMKVRVVPAKRRKFLDLPAWKEAPYALFNVGSFLVFIGLYAPFFYVQSYVIETGLMSPSLAFYLLSILNATSTFGRLIPNYMADRLGPMNIIAPCTFLAGMLSLALIGAHTSASVIVVIAFYGFFSGALVSLPASVYVALAGPKNRGKIGTRMGMGFAATSVGILIGTPITGAILKAGGGRFEYVWAFGGSLTAAGSLCTIAARFRFSKGKMWVKV